MNAENNSRIKWSLGIFLVLQLVVLSAALVCNWEPARIAGIEAPKPPPPTAGDKPDEKPAPPANAPSAVGNKPGAVAASVQLENAVAPAKPDAAAPQAEVKGGAVRSGTTVEECQGPAWFEWVKCWICRLLGAGMGGGDPERIMLKIVLLAGALGASIHALTSFITYVANDKFSASWVGWYLYRAPIGGALGVTVYFVLRAGLMSSGGGSADLNVFGFTAMSLLTGMFNRHAVAKLVKVAEGVFTNPPVEKDALSAKGLVLDKLEPDKTAAGTAAPFNVTLHGDKFGKDALVLVAGMASAVTWVSEKVLTIDLTVAQLAAKGKLPIQVVQPGALGAVSEVKEFEVT